ncbi:MAG: hypothetical protein QXJ50_03635 [Candidatus Woesearchaeota archaeon]
MGKKEEKPATQSSQQQGIPVDIVLGLKAKGLSNNQIIEILQRDGYKTYQIFDALSQAELKSASPVSAEPPKNPTITQAPTYTENNPIPDFNPEITGQQSANAQVFPQPEPFQQAAPPEGGVPVVGEATDAITEQIEEIAEAIIDEKWNEFIVNVNKIIAWKEKTEARMTALEKRMDDLKASVDQLQKAILEKVGEYDKHVTEVGVELKAMEKVFQKVLPTFTSNINELSRIASELKEKK